MEFVLSTMQSTTSAGDLIGCAIDSIARWPQCTFTRRAATRTHTTWS